MVCPILYGNHKNTTFTFNFHELLRTMYKYMLNLVVKISLMFAQYFEYYGIILRGAFFRGHTINYDMFTHELESARSF